jgi:hypothetical protein
MIPCKNAEVMLHWKTHNFKPWTLAYTGTDLTAKPRTPVHAMHDFKPKEVAGLDELGE